MSRYMLDTCAYSRMAEGHGGVTAAIRRATGVVMSPVVIGELRAGYIGGTRRRTNEAELQEFLEAPAVAVVPITVTTADRYAQIRADLKRRGRPIPTNDVWIAASAIEHGLVVLTADQHFAEVEGLEVELLG